MGSIEESFMNALSFQEEALGEFLMKNPNIGDVLSKGDSEESDRILSREIFGKLDQDMLGDLGDSYQQVMIECEYDSDANKFKAYENNGEIKERCQNALNHLKSMTSRFAEGVRSLL